MFSSTMSPLALSAAYVFGVILRGLCEYGIENSNELLLGELAWDINVFLCVRCISVIYAIVIILC